MKRQLDFLTLGHVTRDVLSASQPDDFTLGGTVTFAALTASRLGLAVAVVTCADVRVEERLRAALPDVALYVRSIKQSTTFANTYQHGFRTQYLYARGADLGIDDIPADWLEAGIVLLGPLVQELRPAMITAFPRHKDQILAATPQGWLRRWDADGRVWPTPWQEAEQVLPFLDVLILSHDDLLPFVDGVRTEADAILERWSYLVPLLVATDGRYGATLFERGNARHFPAYTVHEVDPTGAGDVFAAAFLTHLYRHRDPIRAIDFANCTAAFSIEQVGIAGIPTLAQVEQRWRK